MILEAPETLLKDLESEKPFVRPILNSPETLERFARAIVEKWNSDLLALTNKPNLDAAERFSLIATLNRIRRVRDDYLTDADRAAAARAESKVAAMSDREFAEALETVDLRAVKRAYRASVDDVNDRVAIESWNKLDEFALVVARGVETGKLEEDGDESVEATLVAEDFIETLDEAPLGRAFSEWLQGVAAAFADDRAFDDDPISRTTELFVDALDALCARRLEIEQPQLCAGVELARRFGFENLRTALEAEERRQVAQNPPRARAIKFERERLPESLLLLQCADDGVARVPDSIIRACSENRSRSFEIDGERVEVEFLLNESGFRTVFVEVPSKWTVESVALGASPDQTISAKPGEYDRAAWTFPAPKSLEELRKILDDSLWIELRRGDERVSVEM